MEVLNKKVTVEYVRKKYPEKYKNLTDEELEKKINFLYNIAYLGVSSHFHNKFSPETSNKKLNLQSAKLIKSKIPKENE